MSDSAVIRDLKAQVARLRRERDASDATARHLVAALSDRDKELLEKCKRCKRGLR